MRSPRRIIVSLVVLATVFLAGYWLRQPGTPSTRSGARQPLYYRDPMHPAYKSDKPGIAPDCGMQLEPVYADDPVTPGDPGGAMPPGAVRISFEKQQIMGLRTARISLASGPHTVRLLGRVAADESRVYKVTALVEGVVRTASSYSAGSLVQKDDLLATYSVVLREVYDALQGFYLANNNLDRALGMQAYPMVTESAQAQVRIAGELLRSYGFSETQLRQMSLLRQPAQDIEFRAPVTGLILSRSAAAGQRLERGAELFRLADLSRVWVLADVFENESGMIRPGSFARVLYQGRTYRASIGDVRQFDAMSRTLKVRLELDNPALVLRPDMFVDVEVDVTQPEGIDVPMDAVLNSGRSAVVFVSVGEGMFEPRKVVTGARYGDRVRIVEGLEPGETVVVSGLFLLDSESRLRMAAASALKPAAAAAASVVDPVCGMQIDPSQAGGQSEYHGVTYQFCSKTCKAKFDANPAQYAAKRQPAPAKAGR
jgi:membrane fusion protein, copper/silver efflux system